MGSEARDEAAKIRDKWLDINQKYRLNFTYEEIYDRSWDYGHAVEEENGFWTSWWWRGLLILGSVVGTVLTAGALGGVLGLLAFGVGTGATFATFAAFGIQDEAIEEGKRAENAQWQAAAAEWKRAAENERHTSTELLAEDIIEGGYKIYANGSKYKYNAPGVDSGFLSQFAFDPTRGLRGEAVDTQMDNFIQNRSQVSLPGGVSFHSNIVGKSTAKADGALASHIWTAYAARRAQWAEGMSEMTDAKFGKGAQKEVAEKNVIDARARTERPYKIALIELDFLEKNERYSQGRMANFNYLKMSDFDPPPEAKEQVFGETIIDKEREVRFRENELRGLEDERTILRKSLALGVNEAEGRDSLWSGSVSGRIYQINSRIIWLRAKIDGANEWIRAEKAYLARQAAEFNAQNPYIGEPGGHRGER